jgi:hypothetical protein
MPGSDETEVVADKEWNREVALWRAPLCAPILLMSHLKFLNGWHQPQVSGENTVGWS